MLSASRLLERAALNRISAWLMSWAVFMFDDCPRTLGAGKPGILVSSLTLSYNTRARYGAPYVKDISQILARAEAPEIRAGPEALYLGLPHHGRRRRN
jgi:hypothetical protein